MQTNNPLHELIRTIVVTAPAERLSASPAAASGAPLLDGGKAAGSESADATRQNTDQLSQLRNLFAEHIHVTTENTRAVSENTTGRGQSGVGSAIGEVAKTFAGTVAAGFTLNPIVGGLLKLFGGESEQPAPTPLAKYAPPQPIRIEAGVGQSSPSLTPVDHGQSGLPRAMAPQQANVTIQVNAMDSRSFLDRSEDIANAVRRAMLESSALNNVISEL